MNASNITLLKMTISIIIGLISAPAWADPSEATELDALLAEKTSLLNDLRSLNGRLKACPAPHQIQFEKEKEERLLQQQIVELRSLHFQLEDGYSQRVLLGITEATQMTIDRLSAKTDPRDVLAEMDRYVTPARRKMIRTRTVIVPEQIDFEIRNRRQIESRKFEFPRNDQMTAELNEETKSKLRKKMAESLQNSFVHSFDRVAEHYQSGNEELRQLLKEQFIELPSHTYLSVSSYSGKVLDLIQQDRNLIARSEFNPHLISSALSAMDVTSAFILNALRANGTLKRIVALDTCNKHRAEVDDYVKEIETGSTVVSRESVNQLGQRVTQLESSTQNAEIAK